jgi:hypothetical protein
MLPSREHNDFEEPHYHAAGIDERSHDNSWMPGIDLPAILTLDSAEEQTLVIARTALCDRPLDPRPTSPGTSDQPRTPG